MYLLFRYQAVPATTFQAIFQHMLIHANILYIMLLYCVFLLYVFFYV